MGTLKKQSGKKRRKVGVKGTQKWANNGWGSQIVKFIKRKKRNGHKVKGSKAKLGRPGKG